MKVLTSQREVELQHEVQQFLFYEAWLLDKQRFHEWLDLFTEDVLYQMPTRETVQGAPSDVQDDELALQLFDEDKSSLEMRVKRLDTGLAHVEQPSSVTQRLISNVRVTGASGETLNVYSSFMVVQVRRGNDKSLFFGDRDDVLRREDGRLRIARRRIVLTDAILPRAISQFF